MHHQQNAKSLPEDLNYSLDFTQKRPPAVQDKIRDGMARADEHADGQWKHFYDGCVLAAARKKHEITSDDVLAEIESIPNAPSTHNLSAIGPAMKRAAVMGVIAPTDKIVRSERPEKRGNYHKCWTSKVYATNRAIESPVCLDCDSNPCLCGR